MAQTVISSTHDATVKKWVPLVLKDARNDTWLTDFIGGADMPIQEMANAGKGSGDRQRYNLYPSMENISWKVGNETLEGSEANPEPTTDDINIEEYRAAVRYEMNLNEIRLATNLPQEAQSLLKTAVRVQIERLIMNTATGKGDGVRTGGTEAISHFVLPAGRANKASIVATDLLTPAQISRAKYYALNGYESGSGVVRPPLRPFMIEGSPHLLLVITPFQAYDLVRNSEFQQARREAEVRGEKNPLFTGAVGVWDGVIIKTHNMVPTTLISGSDYYAESFLIGQQGLAWCWGKEPKMILSQFDYEKYTGVAFDMICGVNKSRFTLNGTVYDYGIIGVPSAFTNIAATTA